MNNKQRAHAAFLIVMGLLVLALPLQARRLLGEGYEKSRNEFLIQTDGLACYFCAYGLERFFRQTKRIYSMDISLKKGIVRIAFVKGKEIPSDREIRGYVHDAGFSARKIKALLYGKLSKDGKFFVLQDSGQRLPVKGSAVLSKLSGGKKALYIEADVKKAPKYFLLSNIKLADPSKQQKQK